MIVDSGFRRGTDMFKALALGATAVCIGRPYVWGWPGSASPGYPDLRAAGARARAGHAAGRHRTLADINPSFVIDRGHW